MPIGEYSKNSPVNVGANSWDIVPSVALMYTGQSILGKSFGQATEYSARLFYYYYTENHATDYM
ncbi:transporter [Pseudomonas sp.]|uniref:transporter n=1 Tax=Pseudomonas sp. TaxID=306 RepID=UPI0039C9EF95